MSDPVIEVEELTVRYGAAVALDAVSLSVRAGEMVALIGPNGAGKSTLVNTLSGILSPASGRVTVTGRLAHVPEGRQMFGSLTVDDNLRLGAWRDRDRSTGRIYAILPELEPVRRRRAGLLSGGQQQMVALGRALMGRPRALVIDEMSLGLAPLVVAGLAAHLRALNAEEGLAVLLIEQNARLALELCSRAYVLEAGRLVAHGSAAELASSPAVVAAYLGGAA
ncbi:ABC transporter ATP-binding protein [Amorphoplanes digitatis]|uniref:Branched-chain amino acid transport system ATP-binding protein n=1 Tax=Actinoplanes digitatis TaxID=1868 RepID=A0A7W7MPW4_9ACTN|nr:ABC transporter ATP-binding protein [Actinoplanes digitatis]MBB4761809.1 branched-chain amino acid transport system ATP-binding protein [Actinoplanes digitatis]GID90920.1 ABC transporter ATP-binding protein [Actinoplanes digitatis]